MSSDKPLPHDTKGAHRQTDVYDVIAWLEVNKKKVSIAAVVLVIVGFVIATVRYMNQQKEINASSQLLALRASLSSPTNVVAPQAGDFLKIANDFSGTAASERARLLAAAAHFTEGKYSEAERDFNTFVKEFSESPWAPTAAYGIAAAQEAQNKPEAFTSYQNVATRYPNSHLADEARLAVARIHETRKQPDQALRVYNELLAPRPGAQPGEPGHPVAAARKEALFRKHPELNTNTTAIRAASGPQPPAGEPTLKIPAPPVATNAPSTK